MRGIRSPCAVTQASETLCAIIGHNQEAFMENSIDHGPRLLAEGWSVLTDEGFIGLVGPFYRRETHTGPEFCFPTDRRHHNLRGVLQGGALMAFAEAL